MTQAAETPVAGPYAGNGSTTVFAYTFTIDDEDDIEVWLYSSAGVGTKKTITTHYSVSGVGAGSGNVTMVTAPASGEILRLKRKQARVQTTNLINGGLFDLDVLESRLDALTRQIQDIDNAVQRSIQIPPGDTTAVELPKVATRASGVAYFDASGNILAGTPTALSTAVTAAETAQAAAETAEAAAAASAAAAAAANENPGVTVTYDSTASKADPGAGEFRMDSATISSVTTIWIDNADADGNDLQAWLDSWDDSGATASRGQLVIRGIDSPDEFAFFTVTGSITDETGYREISVTFIGGSASFTNAEDFSLFFSAAGATGATGATGAAGATGATGAIGQSAGLLWDYDSTTTDSDPGAGAFRLNNATVTSATLLYIDNSALTVGDVSAWLTAWDDSGEATQRGQLLLHNEDSPDEWAIFTVTGSVVDGTGYRKVSITNIGGSASFTSGETFQVSFTPAGADGADGAGSGDLLAANNLSDLVSASTARTNLGLGALATAGSVNDANWSGTDLAIANGGTGASTASAAFAALKQAATDTATGVVEKSTSGENVTGTATDVFPDVAGVKEMIDTHGAAVDLAPTALDSFLHTTSGTRLLSTLDAAAEWLLFEGVGGGGGGGAGIATYAGGGGGGGAGGAVIVPVSWFNTTIGVTIGLGGAGGPANNSNGSPGGDTIVSSDITGNVDISWEGGGGGGGNGGGSMNDGGTGGSVSGYSFFGPHSNFGLTSIIGGLMGLSGETTNADGTDGADAVASGGGGGPAFNGSGAGGNGGAGKFGGGGGAGACDAGSVGSPGGSTYAGAGGAAGNAAVGQPGTFPGGGGGGEGNSASFAGGAGGNGALRIRSYATFPYTFTPNSTWS